MTIVWTSMTLVNTINDTDAFDSHLVEYKVAYYKKEWTSQTSSIFHKKTSLVFRWNPQNDKLTKLDRTFQKGSKRDKNKYVQSISRITINPKIFREITTVQDTCRSIVNSYFLYKANLINVNIKSAKKDSFISKSDGKVVKKAFKLTDCLVTITSALKSWKQWTILV